MRSAAKRGKNGQKIIIEQGGLSMMVSLDGTPGS